MIKIKLVRHLIYEFCKVVDNPRFFKLDSNLNACLKNKSIDTKSCNLRLNNAKFFKSIVRVNHLKDFTSNLTERQTKFFVPLLEGTTVVELADKTGAKSSYILCCYRECMIKLLKYLIKADKADKTEDSIYGFKFSDRVLNILERRGLVTGQSIVNYYNEFGIEGLYKHFTTKNIEAIYSQVLQPRGIIIDDLSKPIDRRTIKVETAVALILSHKDDKDILTESKLLDLLKHY